MLSLPLAVRDLIAPEVWNISHILHIYNILFLTYAGYKLGTGTEQPDQGCAAWLASVQTAARC